MRHGGLRQAEEGEGLSAEAVVEELVMTLSEKQAEFIAALDEDELPSDRAIRLFRVLGENASRLGRLLRDQRALSGRAADGITSAIAQALDELSTELGGDLP